MTKVAKQKKTAHLQIRMRPFDKGRVQTDASHYADGDMTKWAEHCFKNAPRKFLVKPKEK